MSVSTWLRDRLGEPGPAPTIAGGPSLAHVFGWVLVMLLGVEALTGIGLAAFYSPSSTNAWASVAYVQDQMAWGWVVRGLHHHAASALVIITGIHLVQTAVWGAYKKPRELTWWLGIVLLLLILAFAISGYVLRWDQSGYWANRVELGIAAGTPILGGAIRALAIGGNEYGNLTLTRFYALHVILLPAIVAVVTVAHVKLVRRHGATPRWGQDDAPRPRDAQVLRDVIAMAVVFAIVLAYTIQVGGADLAAPADPSAAYDARPLWYFRWLFELRQLAGSAEKLAALVAPALVAGFLIALPLLDRGEYRAPQRRTPWLGALGGLLAVIGALTVMSFARDSGDAELAKREQKAGELAAKARHLAVVHGVPRTGAQDVYTTVAMYRARLLYGQRCAGCHDEGSKDRKGPIIGLGHGSRAWFKAFLKAPGGDAFWGRTKLAKTDDAMKAVDLPDADLDDVVELLYAQSGAQDIDVARRDRGKGLFDKACNDCHAIEEGAPGASAPGLGGLGTRDWYTSFISNPKSAFHMGPDHSQMPRFDKDLSIVDRDALAEYLGWLRTATPHDQALLEPL